MKTREQKLSHSDPAVTFTPLASQTRDTLWLSPPPTPLHPLLPWEEWLGWRAGEKFLVSRDHQNVGWKPSALSTSSTWVKLWCTGCQHVCLTAGFYRNEIESLRERLLCLFSYWLLFPMSFSQRFSLCQLRLALRGTQSSTVTERSPTQEYKICKFLQTGSIHSYDLLAPP